MKENFTTSQLANHIRSLVIDIQNVSSQLSDDIDRPNYKKIHIDTKMIDELTHDLDKSEFIAQVNHGKFEAKAKQK